MTQQEFMNGRRVHRLAAAQLGVGHVEETWSPGQALKRWGTFFHSTLHLKWSLGRRFRLRLMGYSGADRTEGALANYDDFPPEALLAVMRQHDAYACDLRREGVDVGVISKALGHAHVSTTSTYLDHISPKLVMPHPRDGKCAYRKET